MGRFTGFLGLVIIMGCAWLISTHKNAIKLRILAWGLGLQFAFALLVLKTDFGKIFQAISRGVNAARSCHAYDASSCAIRAASGASPRVVTSTVSPFFGVSANAKPPAIETPSGLRSSEPTPLSKDNPNNN